MLFEKMGRGEGATPLRMAYSLAGAVFLSTLGVGVFAFAIPLLAVHDGISGLLLGATFSGYFLAKLVISPVAGQLSDRTGPRPLLAGAAVAGMLVPLVALASQRHEVLYGVQFCLGLSSGVVKPVATASIAALVPEHKRGRVFGMCNALYNAAFFFGPLLGGLLFYDRNLVPVLAFLTACMTASLVVVLVATPSDLSTASATSRRGEGLGLGKNTQAGTLLLAVFGRTVCTACLVAFYPALLSGSLHGPAWLVGMLFAIPSLVACLGLPLGGRWADKGNRETLTVVGMALSATSLALAGRVETAPGFVLVGVLLGIGSSISFPAAMSLASSLGRQQGRIMGWFHAAANAGFVIGPLLCGLLVRRYGEIPLPMAVMGLVGLVSTLPLGMARILGRGVLSWRSFASAAFAFGLLVVGFICFQGGGMQRTSQASPMSDGPLEFAGLAMGNVIHMNLFGADSEQAGEDSQAAFQTISRLEAEFGHRNPAGAVGRVNLAAGKSPEPVGKPVFELIKRALDICRASSGVFDITIGAVTVLPYYYQEKAEQEKAALIDYRKVVLDEDKRTVFLPEQGMALDLGGLAKGTVLDAAAETLQQRGVPAALVEAGGDLYCYGDRQWKVGIQDPRGDGLLGIISVVNAGVCGSGDYYQYAFTEEDGVTKRKHHILDPTLLDSAGKSIAVTVIAPSAELADALATTLFILGPQEGQILLTHYDHCAALWVLPDRSLVASEGFPPFLEQ